jgi:hypothetical protein
MTVLATDDFIARACLYPDGNLVRLRGTGQEQCCFFAKEFTPKVL